MHISLRQCAEPLKLSINIKYLLYPLQALLSTTSDYVPAAGDYIAVLQTALLIHYQLVIISILISKAPMRKLLSFEVLWEYGTSLIKSYFLHITNMANGMQAPSWHWSIIHTQWLGLANVWNIFPVFESMGENQDISVLKCYFPNDASMYDVFMATDMDYKNRSHLKSLMSLISSLWSIYVHPLNHNCVHNLVTVVLSSTIAFTLLLSIHEKKKQVAKSSKITQSDVFLKLSVSLRFNWLNASRIFHVCSCFIEFIKRVKENR